MVSIYHRRGAGRLRGDCGAFGGVYGANVNSQVDMRFQRHKPANNPAEWFAPAARARAYIYVCMRGRGRERARGVRMAQREGAGAEAGTRTQPEGAGGAGLLKRDMWPIRAKKMVAKSDHLSEQSCKHNNYL